jgi:hypothetical protein
MSKTRKHYARDDMYEDHEDFLEYSNRNKRKEKRLQSALKTRNIDELLDMEDEE